MIGIAFWNNQSGSSSPATGTWTFSNTSATNNFSSASWNGGTGYNAISSLAPDTFTLTPGQSGSDVAPGGIVVSSIAGNNAITITSNSSQAGFVDITIGAQPLQSFALAGDVFGITTVIGLSMIASNNILVTLRD